MAIAKVGSSISYTPGAGNLTSYNASISPTAGNTLVVVCYMRGSTSTAVTVTPNGGTATFTSQKAQLGNSTYLHILTAHNIGAGITSLTIAPNVAARSVLWVAEYSGVDNSTPMDVAATGNAQGSAATASSASITPVTVGALVIGAWGNKSNAATSSPFKATTAGPSAKSGSKAGAGWNAECDLWNQGTTTHACLAVATNVVNDTTGAYQAEWTLAAQDSGANVAIALRPYIEPSIDTGKFFAFL